MDVFVTLSTFGEYSSDPVDRLKDSGVEFQINATGKRLDPGAVIECARDARGIIAGVEPYRRDTLERLPSLRCISRCGAGVDNIDLEAARDLGIAIRNTPDAPTDAVAELTLGMMLALLRNIPEVDRLTHDRAWKRVPGNLLRRKKVALIGLGRIGRRVAELLGPFGTDIVAVDPAPNLEWCSRNRVTLCELAEALGTADIVSLHAGNVSKKPLLGPDELSSCKRGCFILNMARGDLLDDAALDAAIRGGAVAGAALDVFPEEPYTGPLCDNPRVILSPHQATLTVETRTQMEVESVENLLAFLRECRDAAHPVVASHA